MSSSLKVDLINLIDHLMTKYISTLINNNNTFL